MTHLRTPLGVRSVWFYTTVAASLLLLFTTATTFAQDAPTTRGVIQWQSGPAATPVQNADAISQNLAAAKRGDTRHVVVQFAGPLTPQARKQLEANGLRVLSYLGDNAFFATLNSSRIQPQAVLNAAELRCVLPIQRAWKLHPDLLLKQPPAWSIAQPKPDAPDGQTIQALIVQFHPDVPVESKGVRTARLHGARVVSVLESINALTIELPADNVDGLTDEDSVMWVEPPLPPLEPCNDSNRTRVGADTIQNPPYSLDGTGVSVLVYDGGTADANHQDLGNTTVRDSSGTHYHSTHVAGTVGGSGAESGGTYRGMAPGVTIESYGFEVEGGLQPGFLYTDPGDLEEDYSEAINTYGTHISNNSIGTNTAPNGYDCSWEGNYGTTGVLIDTIVRGDSSNPLFTQPYRIAWANGNERSSGRCGTTYHTTAPPACAKNHITVGALNSNDDSVTYFTSWGPTDDNRLKPDISAPGCQSNDDNGVTSCDSYGGYTSLCGTSMASPTVCGLGAILLQDFRQQYPDLPDFRNSTLKVLLAHTAEDLFNPGPDYQTGYGSVRIVPAVELLRSGNFLEAEIGQGDVHSVVVIVQPGENLKVTIAWDDVPGTADVMPVLVNDLDLRVYDEGGSLYYPWTLGGLDNPDAPAVQTEPDHVNNIEQVFIESPAPGAYYVEVYGYNVPQGPQPFSLTATPYLVNCSSAGTANLDRDKYACESTAMLRVVDCDLNTSDDVIDTVDVTIASTTEPAGEIVTLVETAPESAAFMGEITLSVSTGTGVLTVSPDDVVTLTYNDADTGDGQPAVVTDTAVVDCTGPAILNVTMADVQPRDATITFQTDEDAHTVVFWGTDCGALTHTEEAFGFRTDHTIHITGLQDNSTYYFAVFAEDEAGNESYDDNGGVCYTFSTPEVPDFFTEAFTGDNDLDNSTLYFIPNGSNDFYQACIDMNVDSLPTDPAGGSTLSLSDDDNEMVSVSGGEVVSLYGQTYSSFYVGSNGYITFNSGDTDYTESLEDHFNLPRISALFDDLNPSSGGTISSKQLSDRVAVTWQGVPEYSNTGSNTFQIEMFFDGTITITHLSCDSGDNIVGLSAGDGLDPDFYENDLSAIGPCEPTPPTAVNSSEEVTPGSQNVFTLQAHDDGLPDPPAALSIIITELAENGTLADPQGGPITSVPYELLNYGNQVEYFASPYAVGDDTIRFKANDGGDPGDGGGDSNVAAVFIESIDTVRQLYNFPLDSNPDWGTEGQWAFGMPTGGGSHAGDPGSGFTGDYVYGYNLAGDYASNINDTHYLTLGPIDCSDAAEVELKFRRWLGIEQWDHVSVEASANGTDWTVLWSNTTMIDDGAWVAQAFDIADVVDGSENVYVRWGLGPTDYSVTYPGWNIDDIELWGMAPRGVCPGDANCDGLINFADIMYFVTALGNGYDGWYAKHMDETGIAPTCPFANCDTNGSDGVTFEDIVPFADLIGTSCP